jgi:hypothetical protein
VAVVPAALHSEEKALQQKSARSARAQLAFTGFLQVIFVSMNTIYVTRGAWVALIVTSFCISFLWSGNVKRIAFGDMGDRIVYASGAALGCLVGVLVAQAVMA